VLTAQQNLLGSQQQLALTTTNVSSNLVAVYKALGGGWETQMPAANDDLSPLGAPHL
jgi:outer membrane protein TolC